MKYKLLQRLRAALEVMVSKQIVIGSIRHDCTYEDPRPEIDYLKFFHTEHPKPILFDALRKRLDSFEKTDRMGSWQLVARELTSVEEAVKYLNKGTAVYVGDIDDLNDHGSCYHLNRNNNIVCHKWHHEINSLEGTPALIREGYESMNGEYEFRRLMEEAMSYGTEMRKVYIKVYEEKPREWRKVIEE